MYFVVMITVIQWSRNNSPLNSSLSLNLQENSGSQVLLTVDPQVSLTEPITVTATISGTGKSLKHIAVENDFPPSLCL